MLSTLIAVAVSLAQSTSPFGFARDSRLWIEGDSNLHRWSCEAGNLDASFDVDGNTIVPQGLAVSIPVARMDCGEGKMNDKMREALKSSTFPAIEYVLVSADRLPGAALKLKVTGKLTIAGQTHDVVFVVNGTTAPDGSIHAKGSLPLSMTDYGVEPPSALFGAIHAYPRILVKFDLHAVPRITPHA